MSADFTALYEAHRPRLLRQISKLMRDADDAEDIVQETFIRLSAEISLRREPDEIGSWLYRVGFNLAVSGLRHSQVVARRLPQLAQTPPTEPDRVVSGREAWAVMQGALLSLEAIERAAVLLSADGRRSEEVAMAIGRTPGATRTLVCRARAKLRAVDPDAFAAQSAAAP